jgi:hypothetical protein
MSVCKDCLDEGIHYLAPQHRLAGKWLEFSKRLIYLKTQENGDENQNAKVAAVDYA